MDVLVFFVLFAGYGDGLSIFSSMTLKEVTSVDFF